MAIQKREFALELKREAVALLESSGRSTSQIVAAIGIMPALLRAWRRKLNGEAVPQSTRSIS